MKTHLPAIILCLLFPLTALTQAPVPEACAFSYGTFTEATPMPFPLAGMASGVIDGKIYLASGYDMGPDEETIYPDHLSVFDPESNTWDTTGAAIPMNRDMYMANNTALDGKLYVIGGLDFIWADNAWLGIPFARVDAYDPQSDTWELKANLPVPLGGNGVCTMDGKIYVTGGLTTEAQMKSFYSYDPGTDSWESLTEMPIPRVFHVSVALDGRIYVISGNSGGGTQNRTTDCIAYDPDSDQWDDIAPLPKAVTFAAACVVDGEIYVFGGSESSGFSADAYKYNPETDTWISLEKMIPNRRDIVAVPIGRTIYLIGGRTSGSVVNNSVQAYELSKVKLDSPISVESVGEDPVHVDLSDHFSHKDGGSITYSVCQDGSGIVDAMVDGSMLTLTGLAVGDEEVHVLAQSGEDRMGDAFMVHVEYVAPETCEFNYGVYTELAAMPVKAASMASGVIDGKIYLAGGYDLSQDGEDMLIDHLSVYDPETNTWDTTGARIPLPRYMDGARNIALDGKLYLIGGAKWVQTGEDVWQAITYARVDVYNPQSDTWELKANLPVPLGANGVCSMDGKFYVTGGGINESNILNSFYSYDPETDSWEVLTEMPGPRIFHASVALDGKIYVIGGNDSENISALASVIVYDPDADQWAPIASLPKRIFDPGACVLDGEIYVFGGSTRPDILGEAFKYNPEEDTWLTLEEFDPDRVKHSVVPIGRTVYIIGGIEYGDSVRNNVQAFELSDVCLDACIPDTIVEKNNMEIDLSMYFSHVDGGEIRYSVCCDQSDILDVSVTGSILTIERLRDGSGEIHVIANSGTHKMGDVFKVDFKTGGEENICETPAALRIYPNPSHGMTTLAYSVQEPCRVRLELFDLLGKRVAIPVDEYRTPGEFEYQLDTGELIPGIYLCNLTTAGERIMVKLVVEH